MGRAGEVPLGLVLGRVGFSASFLRYVTRTDYVSGAAFKKV